MRLKEFQNHFQFNTIRIRKQKFYSYYIFSENLTMKLAPKIFKMNNRYKIVLSILTQKRVLLENINYLDDEFMDFVITICPGSSVETTHKNSAIFIPGNPNHKKEVNFKFISHLKHFIDPALILISFLEIELTLSGQTHSTEDENILSSLKVKLSFLKKFQIEIESQIIIYSFLENKHGIVKLINNSPIEKITPIQFIASPKRISALIINQGCNDFVCKQIREFLLENVPDMRIDMDKRKRPYDIEDAQNPNVGIDCMLFSEFYFENFGMSKFDAEIMKKSMSNLFKKIISNDSIDDKIHCIALILFSFGSGISTIELEKNEKTIEILNEIRKFHEFKWQFTGKNLKIEGSYFQFN